MAAMKWVYVDFQWRKLTLADKVEATRVIPLTPYLAQQLATLPRVNEFVFASKGKAGRITDTRASHVKALQSAYDVWQAEQRFKAVPTHVQPAPLMTA